MLLSMSSRLLKLTLYSLVFLFQQAKAEEPITMDAIDEPSEMRGLQGSSVRDQLSLSEAIAQNFVLQELEKFFLSSELLPEIEGEDSRITLLTPWDYAFKSMDADFTSKLTDQAWIAHLQNLLHYHMTVDLPPESVEDEQTLTMSNGEEVVMTRRRGTKRFRVDGNRVLATYKATNGYAYMLDHVLIPAWVTRTLAEIPLSTGGPLSTFASLTAFAEIDYLLNNPDETLTIFAPNNNAFLALGDSLLNSLTSDAGLPILRDILRLHIVDNGPYPSASFATQTLSTLHTKDIQMIESGSTTTLQTSATSSQATVVLKDYQLANNGLIHVIDSVLTFHDGPLFSDTPTSRPTSEPTNAPISASPTRGPTNQPTPGPTSKPTSGPTSGPTRTQGLTSPPTNEPTSANPTSAPTTTAPTKVPSENTALPTSSPQDETSLPTSTPATRLPTKSPSASSTSSPSVAPTKRPTTASPTGEPTNTPDSVDCSNCICPAGKDLVGDKCIDPCPPGPNNELLFGSGTECHFPCPEFYRDVGSYCIKREFSRAEYETQQQCENAEGTNCVECGATIFTKDWYPDCGPNFESSSATCSKCFASASCPAGYDGVLPLDAACKKPTPVTRSEGVTLACATTCVEEARLLADQAACLSKAFTETGSQFNFLEIVEGFASWGEIDSALDFVKAIPEFACPALTAGFMPQAFRLALAACGLGSITPYIGLQLEGNFKAFELIFTVAVAFDPDGNVGCFFQGCPGITLGPGVDPIDVAGNIVVGVLFDDDICTFEGYSVAGELDVGALDLNGGIGIEVALNSACPLDHTKWKYTAELALEVASLDLFDPSKLPDVSVGVGFCGTWLESDVGDQCPPASCTRR